MKLTRTEYIIAIVLALVMLLGVVTAITANARQNNNDQVVIQAQGQDNVAAHLEVASETTATSTVLIDLSDTTNFPHFTTNPLEISQIRVHWFTDVVATTTLKFGIIASSTLTGDLVDVYWFDEISFSSLVATDRARQQVTIDYGLSYMKMDLANGVPNSFLTNDSTTLTGDYATTTSLLSPNGYINPGVGDVVMQVWEQSGTATSTVTVLYRTKF